VNAIIPVVNAEDATPTVLLTLPLAHGDALAISFHCWQQHADLL